MLGLAWVFGVDDFSVINALGREKKVGLMLPHICIATYILPAFQSVGPWKRQHVRECCMGWNTFGGGLSLNYEGLFSHVYLYFYNLS